MVPCKSQYLLLTFYFAILRQFLIVSEYPFPHQNPYKDEHNTLGNIKSTRVEEF